MNLAPRIWKVTYKSGHNRRVVTAIAKVPYAGVFAMSEALARASTQGEITWFRVEPAKPSEIDAARATLQRWPQALDQTSKITKVKWFE